MATYVFKWSKPISNIIRDLGIGQKLNLFCANTAYKKMFDYVPFDTGSLAENVDISATFKEGLIVFKSPYAKKMYNGNGFNFCKEKHPLSTAYWDKAMMAAKGTELAKEVSEYRKALRTC